MVLIFLLKCLKKHFKKFNITLTENKKIYIYKISEIYMNIRK